MKKALSTSLLLFLIGILYLIIIPVTTSAQKLPNIQEASLRAPAGIKVDGKATEWNNQFQAYNKATEIFYTISNDDDKLYLAVQATDLDIINKIICAGITLTINGTGKMKDQGGIAITYPIIEIQNRQSGPSADLDNQFKLQADSFILALNAEFGSKAKDIRVEGVKEIPNHLISIYNPEGIKAAAYFDDKTNFTYELAVPLKYLGLSVSESKPFVYNIKLRSLEGGYPGTVDFKGAPTDVGQPFIKALNVQRRSIKTIMFKSLDRENNTAIWGDRLLNLVNPTDFWGEYTLSKK